VKAKEDANMIKTSSTRTPDTSLASDEGNYTGLAQQVRGAPAALISALRSPNAAEGFAQTTPEQDIAAGRLQLCCGMLLTMWC
jgi:hypothetical protein